MALILLMIAGVISSNTRRLVSGNEVINGVFLLHMIVKDANPCLVKT